MTDFFLKLVRSESAYLRQYLDVFEAHVAGKLPQRYLNQSLIATCCWLEAALHSRVTAAQSATGWRLELDADCERGLKKYKSHLQAAGIAFPGNTPEWARAISLYKVRNAIVHNDGDGFSLAESEQKLLEKHGCVSTDSVREIQLTVAFCRQAITDVEALLVLLNAVLSDEQKLV